MLTASKQNNGVRYNSADNGKCICVSFPAHELNLIEELDNLANQEFITRSQYIRRMIRREKRNASASKWTTLYGDK